MMTDEMRADHPLHKWSMSCLVLSRISKNCVACVPQSFKYKSFCRRTNNCPFLRSSFSDKMFLLGIRSDRIRSPTARSRIMFFLKASVADHRSFTLCIPYVCRTCSFVLHVPCGHYWHWTCALFFKTR